MKNGHLLGTKEKSTEMDRFKLNVEIMGVKEIREVSVGHSGLAEDLDFVVAIEMGDMAIGNFQ